MNGRDGVRRFREHLEETTGELAALDHENAPKLPIHGDFTTDNILIDGDPPAIVGAIDFALTNWEPVVADLAFALYRSGRHDPSDLSLDPRRVADVVAGYAERRALPQSTPSAVPVYAKARGLQLIVRWSRARLTDCSITLARVESIAKQRQELVTALS